MVRPLLALMLACAMAAAASDPSSDLQTVRRQLVALIAPTAPAGAKAAQAVAEQRADGTWASVDYADTQRSAWRASQHLTRHCRVLAERLHAGQDPAAAEALRRGLDAWYRMDLRNSNWWHNEIGVPMALGDILLLAGDAVDAERRAKACAIMRRSVHARWTGQNLVWGVGIQIARGCIEDDAEAVGSGFERFFREVRTGAPPWEGVQVDWSFHQHGNVLYAGGYGQGFACDGARLVRMAAGTRFAAPPAVVDVLVGYALDGQRWMIRGDHWDWGAVGRELVRAGKDARWLAAAPRLLAEAGAPRAAELRAMHEAIATAAPTAMVEGNRHFWCSDYMAHQRPGYMASVRMHSTRVDNTDSLTNDENKRTHFIADGATCLMRDGREYVDIFPAWDWQLIPGITCEQRPAMPEPRSVRRHGATAFVGGVSDGRVGLAAMQHRRDGLSARKAWLMLDDAVVCLGAGIACASGNPVATAVNQCLLRGPAVRAPGDGPWAWHDGFGYALLQPGALRMSAGPQAGSWRDIGVGKAEQVSVPVFALSIDHGRDPAAAAYAYAILPGVGAADMPALAAAPRVRVLANTPQLQAAADATVTGAVFHEPGRLDADLPLMVDQPCLVLLRRDGGSLVLAVANPENRALAVTLDIGLVLAGDGVERTPGGSRLRLELPDGPAAGSSVVRRLAIAR